MTELKPQVSQNIGERQKIRNFGIITRDVRKMIINSPSQPVHYLQPNEIMGLLQSLLPNDYEVNPTRNTVNAERILAKGSSPFYAPMDVRTMSKRNSALNTLRSFCNRRKSEIVRNAQRNGATDEQLRHFLIPVETIFLSILYTKTPEKYELIKRNIQRNKGGEFA